MELHLAKKQKWSGKGLILVVEVAHRVLSTFLHNEGELDPDGTRTWWSVRQGMSE